ncbi:MAG: L-serine ammonia-lyase, iron-sulfur-dependent, subunit alpha [Oscillospiraceae bacterium]|jgi:L-serine dehydratase|nr:L-serine ammonia-lyase, iron-sulfur-dependent, subunit alpha [Oscillospiraceae bacterium]
MLEHAIAELVQAAGSGSIAAIARQDQARANHQDEAVLNDKMRAALLVMRESVAEGLNPDLRSVSGMTGGQAALLNALAERGGVSGQQLGRAIAMALAVAECNASMGKIVAAPTAGACGILPAALLTAQEARGYSDDQLVDALFTAAAIGRVIARRASISGAEGGCQAECGSAAAMAAAALVELSGGTAQMAADACAFAMMNSLGLICDPVGGLVEVPCVYRNVAGVAVAMTAADLALAGIPSPIAADEVIDAMKAVGDAMPVSLRETGEGGCAACRVRR